jgi:hypothetical protein
VLSPADADSHLIPHAAEQVQIASNTTQPSVWDLAPAIPTPTALDRLAKAKDVGNVVMVLDDMRDVFYPDGSFEEYRHVLIKANASAECSFDFEEVKELEGFVIKADGTTRQIIKGSVGGNQQISLDPGDLLEMKTHSYNLPTVSGRPGVFSSHKKFSFGMPVLLSRFVVVTPANWRRFSTLTHGTVPTPTMRETHGWRIAEWCATDVPAMCVEEMSPAEMDYADWVQLSNLKSWREAVRILHGSFISASRPDKSVRDMANALIQDAHSEHEKIRRLANFVINQIKYRIHASYEPAQASLVLRERQGDCKDKSTLLIALLAAVNIKADAVLLPTRSNAMNKYLPNYSFWDHTVTLVHASNGTVWIDTTLETPIDLGILPYPYTGVPALIMNDTTTDLIQTPISSVELNTETYDFHLTLDKAGNLSGWLELQATGNRGWVGREVYKGYASDTTKALEAFCKNIDATATCEAGSITGILDSVTPFRINMKFTVPNKAKRQGDNLLMALPVIAIAPLLNGAPRKMDAEIPQTYGKYCATIHLQLPDGYTVEKLPKQQVTSPWGSYMETATLQGNMLTVQWEATQTVLRVPVTETAQYYKFMCDMYQASEALLELKTIELTPTATQASAH